MKTTAIERLKLLLKIVAMLLLWVGIAWSLYALKGVVQSRYDSTVVERVEINIADSTARGNLVTTEMVRQMLKKEHIEYEGVTLSKVPLRQIERVIGRNGFVERVRAYTTSTGLLHIGVWQRAALVRFMSDGYNCYIAKGGYIFPAPSYAALHTGVISGNYTTHFPASYIGNIEDYTLAEIEKLEHEIESIEREKYPIYQREQQNNEDRREMRRRYINKSVFESDEIFAAKVVKLREENYKLRNTYAYRQRVIESELRAIELRQERLRARQKKLLNYCDDVHNLITFVEIIEADDFWRSEVVQISLSRGDDLMMDLSLSVRSANFKVDFGSLTIPRAINVVVDDKFRKRSLDNKRVTRYSCEKRLGKDEVAKSIKQRLDKLRDFYEDALPRVGWDRYKRISIEFDDQIVCTK